MENFAGNTSGRGLRKTVQPIELSTIGKKQVSLYGWRYPLVLQHLATHLTQMSGKWCSVECMAKTIFNRASESNKTKVRRNIPPLFKQLLEQGNFLVIEYDSTPNSHGKIKAVKIFERGNVTPQEAEYAQNQLDRLSKRLGLSEAMQEKARTALGLR